MSLLITDAFRDEKIARKQRLQHARDLVRKYARKDVSVVDELIQERRKEIPPSLPLPRMEPDGGC